MHSLTPIKLFWAFMILGFLTKYRARVHSGPGGDTIVLLILCKVHRDDISRIFSRVVSIFLFPQFPQAKVEVTEIQSKDRDWWKQVRRYFCSHGVRETCNRYDTPRESNCVYFPDIKSFSHFCKSMKRRDLNTTGAHDRLGINCFSLQHSRFFCHPKTNAILAKPLLYILQGVPIPINM